MNRTPACTIPLLALALAVAGSPGRPLAAQTARAVMFFSPTCPHCRQVIREDLPIYFQVYGGDPRVVAPRPPDGGPPAAILLTNGTLDLLLIDASQPDGHALYDASLASHPTAPGRSGVPRLVIADSVLVGAVEIPANLHGLIRSALARGGVPWPAIPGLDSVLGAVAGPADPAVAAIPRGTTAGAGTAPATGGAPAESPPVEGAEPAGDTIGKAAATPKTPSFVDLIPDDAPSLRERLGRDPVANGLAVLVLVVMVAVVVAVLARGPARRVDRPPGLVFPALALAGAAIAAYLTYVETTGTLAVCGPIGDCNTVQQSPYATLFGVPIGALGLAGYGAIAVLWVVARGAAGRPAALARATLVFATLWGTLFSIYLTFLEPFVIGATCLWCLSSAVIMTGLLWLAARWGSAPAAT